jgi:UMF1 family MFS transporter
MPTADTPPFPRPFRQKAVWGWMAFDFAAQPFFTVVITFVFGPYLVSQMAVDPATGQTAWGLAAAAASILVALFSPFLGAVADRTGARKPWIACFAAVKILALCALWTAAPGTSLFAALTLLVLAQVAAEFSIVFNDAMIPRLVRPADIGRVSNLAWGLGYLGGMIFLGLTLAFVAASPESGQTLAGLPPLFGLDPATGEGARATAPMAGLWYLVFVLPMFLFTPDVAVREPIGRAVRDALGDLAGTLREARTRRPLFRFLLARMAYQDGVNALLVLGGAFAAGMFGWSVTETGLFGILLTVTAIFGCAIAGLLEAKLGSKRVIVASILCLVLATLGIVSTGTQSTLFGLLAWPAPTPGTGLFATPAERAYLGWGLLIGLAFGPIQASSRAWLAQSVSPREAGRYFGLYSLTGRATSFLATLSVAALTYLAAQWTSPELATRLGMSAILAFFLVGLALLWGTPSPERQAVSTA